MSVRPLGIIREIVESAGMELAYAYDDLIFVHHNAFLFQFTEKDNEMLVHVNKEADEGEVLKSISLIRTAAADRNMVIVRGKYYTLVQADDEHVRLALSDTKE